MLEYIDILNEYIWLADFAVLCVVGALSIALRKNTSSLITVGVVVLITGVILQYKNLINGFISPDTSQTTFILWCGGFILFDLAMACLIWWHARLLTASSKPQIARVALIAGGGLLCIVAYAQYGTLMQLQDALSWKAWRLAAYHFGYVGFAVLTLYGLRKFHQFADLEIGILAKTYGLAFLMSALIHLLRFFEKFVLHNHEVLAGIYKWGMASINICTSVISILVAIFALYQYFAHSKHKGPLWEL